MLPGHTDAFEAIDCPGSTESILLKHLCLLCVWNHNHRNVIQMQLFQYHREASAKPVRSIYKQSIWHPEHPVPATQVTVCNSSAWSARSPPAKAAKDQWCLFKAKADFGAQMRVHLVTDVQAVRWPRLGLGALILRYYWAEWVAWSSSACRGQFYQCVSPSRKRARAATIQWESLHCPATSHRWRRSPILPW